ncbi:hypothetical protein ZIOFF_048664 [Zingiber officinale]|uniref:PH domain-containing protein n=1 Tax=Zingiber officinale TaxID=94328 RepID=A0A8J5FZN3_ZINOF|nr:hypothetical protein ZIOFF_048664 [Zingiber officinale]
MRSTKEKKTWIRALSLLFKFREKKSGAEEAAALKAKSSRLSGAEQKPRSGPLFVNSRRFGQLHEKMGLSSSGPLSFCFTPTRAEETEVPYSCLGHQNHALAVQAFGPIYLFAPYRARVFTLHTHGRSIEIQAPKSHCRRPDSTEIQAPGSQLVTHECAKQIVRLAVLKSILHTHRAWPSQGK